jgi:Beta xylosidase C-terminal Concanavalin A-like domain
VKPSRLNLTAENGNYAGPEGQSFVGRRQQDTLFTFSVNLEFTPQMLEEEAGITAFLTQNHQYHMGLVMLPGLEGGLNPHIRFRAESYVPVPAPVVMPLPQAWKGQKLAMEIKASNFTHFAFSVGPANAQSQMRTIVVAPTDALSWGFTGK